MGEVWEARHLALGASVAIKFAAQRSASDAAFGERFRREACAMAQLRSPNIVQIFDVSVASGEPYLVMELLSGESLRCRLEREKTLPLPVCVELAKQVGRALAVIHRFGMVHRDVTPANLFLVEPSADYPELYAKLLDFGIAKQVLAETRITTSGTLIGSPAYMSPEQARAEVLDARSDLWSFGAVLYRCVSGKDAFEASSLTDVLFKICTGEVPRCTADNPQLPAALDAFFERAFARNVEFRFESALEMVQAFAATVGLHLPNDAERDMAQLGLRLRGTTSNIRVDLSRPRLSKWLAARPSAVVACIGLGFGLGFGFGPSLRPGTAPGSTEAPPPLAETPTTANLPPVVTPMPVTASSSPRVERAAERAPGAERATGVERATATAPSNPGSVTTPSRSSAVRPLAAARGSGRPLPESRTSASSGSVAQPPAAAVDPLFGLPLRESNHAQPNYSPDLPGGGTQHP